VRILPIVSLLLLAAPSAVAQRIPSLPDSAGWGVHVLALARAPDSSTWVGTYGQGIFVLRPHGRGWEHIRHQADTSARSISWDFVHAFAFGPNGEVWYGTVGNGWGLSRDGGRTWRNWEFADLGPEWQYVVPNGIVTHSDTTYVATADGIKVTGDDGESWWVITDSAGATTTGDSVLGRIQNQYVLAIAAGPGTNLWVATLRGLGHSPDGGRTWHERLPMVPCTGHTCVNRARALLVDSSTGVWVGTEQGLFRFGQGFGGWATPGGMACLAGAACPARALVVASLTGRYAGTSIGPLQVMDTGAVAATGEASQLIVAGPDGLSTCDVAGDRGRVDAEPRPEPAARPTAPRHTWFRRPIAHADQPYIDQTYRFGSTMGGNFQPHQGVEFNNPDGTPVHAIGDGVVVYSGPAEAGANTVAIRHWRRLTVDGERRYLFSVYYHNTKLLVHVGQQVRVGDVIALVGNTGRATNDHLHLEVHIAPTTDSSKIVDPAVRYPPFNVNPELWITPLPGTGLVAGQVWDSAERPVFQARIRGLVKPEPQETPFSFIETYGPRNHGDPLYQEHFAVSDVPPGEYLLGVEIDGNRVSRRVVVRPGQLTWVVFRPAARR
jgi:murein DD-endopeptidase MepM/ murein hydrolase activator NlpD